MDEIVHAGDETRALEHRVAMATTFGWSVVSGLTAMVWREKGEIALNAVWRALMSAEQRERFIAALEKLGIAGEPPAVTAAKYHYFSNSIGGLTMQYIEETPKKVWIRYLPPWGTYPGIAALAVPTSVRRTILSTWHPRNGELLGCPRLGWVATKFVSEGHAYDEGYFMEYDHDLRLDERFRVEHVEKTPEFIAANAPRLDPAVWPEARILKGSANYAADYVKHAIEIMVQVLGMQTACQLIEAAMKLLAVQTIGSLKALAGMHGDGALPIAKTYQDILRSFKNQTILTEAGPNRVELSFERYAPFPFPESARLREAVFAFFEMGVRVHDGHVRIERRFDVDSLTETWTFTDTHTWLW